ncbi:transposase [Mesorhizobium sp. M1027]
MEPLTGEIKRHTDFVGIFPNDDAIIRLVGAIVLEQTDEWQSSARHTAMKSVWLAQQLFNWRHKEKAEIQSSSNSGVRAKTCRLLKCGSNKAGGLKCRQLMRRTSDPSRLNLEGGCTFDQTAGL